MTERFRGAHQRTRGHEGYYANVDWDDGKETYCGISRKHNPDWEGWPIIDAYKKAQGGKIPWNHRIPSDHLHELVKQRYFEKYWLPIRADEIRGNALTDLLFDFYVQSGSHAVRALQDAINHLGHQPRLLRDGDLGPKTVAACNAVPHQQVHDLLKEYRKTFLRNWARRKNKPDSVLTAVLNRVDQFPDQYQA